MAKSEETITDLAKVDVPFGEMGFSPTTMTEAWRFANALAHSKLVPDSYRNEPDSCMIALDLAARLDVSWIVVMQHVYEVHGRSAMDAALVISLVNKSGLFIDPIEYDVYGSDAKDKSYRVRAWAVRKRTKKKLFGPWIDWPLVEAEQWDQKKGSKWLSMPEQMFHYRAAAWFQRRYAPEVALGMLTAQEVEDMPRVIESTVVEKGVQGLKDRLQERDEATEPVKGEEIDESTDEALDEAERRKTAAEAKRQKEALATADQETAEQEDKAPETEDEAETDQPDLSGETASIFDN